jgi:cold-inducible RNA-binding protein
MSKKLYVGNLPFSTTDDTLQSLFAEKGEVATANIVKDKFSGRSRGFGFVEMNNDDEATAAIEALNDFEVDGRKLVVNEARPMKKREFGDGGGGGGGRDGGKKRDFNRRW